MDEKSGYAIGGEIGKRVSSTVLSTVEEYDTGFAIEPKGKLVTSWGKLKAGD